MAFYFSSSLWTEVCGNTISSCSACTVPATPRRTASLQQLIFHISAWHCQGNTKHGGQLLPFEAIVPHELWTYAQPKWLNARGGEKVRWERWEYYFHKRIELNSQEASGRRMRTAFIICQVGLRCITITTQFSPSSKTIRSVIYPPFPRKETEDQK